MSELVGNPHRDDDNYYCQNNDVQHVALYLYI